MICKVLNSYDQCYWQFTKEAHTWTLPMIVILSTPIGKWMHPNLFVWAATRTDLSLFHLITVKPFDCEVWKCMLVWLAYARPVPMCDVIIYNSGLDFDFHHSNTCPLIQSLTNNYYSRPYHPASIIKGSSACIDPSISHRDLRADMVAEKRLLVCVGRRLLCYHKCLCSRLHCGLQLARQL